MALAPKIVIAFVALLHFAFMALEMFFWDKPLGRRIFGHSAEHAHITRVLAANQGLYNGFLGAGLLWSAFLGPSGMLLQLFFLTCVVIAGVYGAATFSRTILWVQALPAAIGIAMVLWMR